jgi:tRNA modification GTPase
MHGKGMDWDDTIVALATPAGVGAIGVLRLSGSKAFDLVNQVFPAKNLLDQPSHSLHVGWLKHKGKAIDEVVVALYKNPKSYTGEDVVEISCHGSPFIQQQLMQVLVQLGARMALPGEFTQRAFLNHKKDLSQAEAVADLIASSNQAAQTIALNQMRGGFSSELKQLRADLINCTALLELELDFAEEDVDFVSKSQLIELVEKIIGKINPLIESFAFGNAIKTGIPVAIVGKPNAGKSSLLNVLLNENRAIVSAIAGTTRDTIEEQLVIDGIGFRFIDTAGIRNTTDEIESIGIERAFAKAKTSAIVLYLFDQENTSKEEVVSDYHLLKTPQNKIVICPTKIDLYKNFDWESWMVYLKEKTDFTSLIGISAKEGTNIGTLRHTLVEPYQSIATDEGNTIVANQRHLQELSTGKTALVAAAAGLQQGLSGDLVSLHLREAIRSIGNITGEVELDRDILGTIFSKFCIGK